MIRMIRMDYFIIKSIAIALISHRHQNSFATISVRKSHHRQALGLFWGTARALRRG